MPYNADALGVKVFNKLVIVKLSKTLETGMATVVIIIGKSVAISRLIDILLP